MYICIRFCVCFGTLVCRFPAVYKNELENTLARANAALGNVKRTRDNRFEDLTEMLEKSRTQPVDAERRLLGFRSFETRQFEGIEYRTISEFSAPRLSPIPMPKQSKKLAWQAFEVHSTRQIPIKKHPRSIIYHEK